MKKVPWAQADLVIRSCSVSRRPPGFTIPRDWFSTIRDFDLWIILSGQAEASPPDGPPLLLSRGSCLWLAPGRQYDINIKEDGLTTAWVHFDLLGPDGKVLDPKEVEFPQPHGEILNSQMFEQIIQRILLLHYEYRDGAHHQSLAIATAAHLLKGLLLEFEFAQVRQESLKPLGIARHHHEVISEALSWIYFNPVEATSAGAVAKKFGYSLKHFCRIFRGITGKTPSRAIIETRIERAKELLSDSSLNITEIADRLNYENAFYFSKQFKKVEGESPSQYRLKIKAG